MSAASSSKSTITFSCPVAQETSNGGENGQNQSGRQKFVPLKIQAEITDLQKPTQPILTGIGFLDHMLDQFNSHAQIGVSFLVTNHVDDADSDLSFEKDHAHRNRLAKKAHTVIDQTPLFQRIGTLLGQQFRRILNDKQIPVGATSFFGCPLDEALVLVTLETVSDQGSLAGYNLRPYGSFPSPQGRQYLGHMALAPLEDFWTAVAEQAGLRVTFRKLRGENAHHIVEAAFKAFARAMRNLIGGIDTILVSTTTTNGSGLASLYGPDSANVQASVALERSGSVTRQTKETSIECVLKLDEGASGTHVSMGLQGMDQFWTRVSQEARVSLQATCQGDLWIDEHHTTEDVAIALGQVWNQALGTKAGLNRMWCSTVVQGTAKVIVVLDLSNRPMLTHNLPLRQHKTEHLQNVPVEMLEHVLDSFVVNARMTLHIVVESSSSSQEEGGSEGIATLEDAWDGLAIALGRALRYGILVDQRRAGATASSKGTLSV